MFSPVPKPTSSTCPVACATIGWRYCSKGVAMHLSSKRGKIKVRQRPIAMPPYKSFNTTAGKLLDIHWLQFWLLRPFGPTIHRQRGEYINDVAREFTLWLRSRCFDMLPSICQVEHEDVARPHVGERYCDCYNAGSCGVSGWSSSQASRLSWASQAVLRVINWSTSRGI